jgi:hypothetical protein
MVEERGELIDERLTFHLEFPPSDAHYAEIERCLRLTPTERLRQHELWRQFGLRHIAPERRRFFVVGQSVTRQERLLQENVLNALDRLFDRRCRVIDVHDLILATCEALKGSEFSAKAEPVAAELLRIVRSGQSPEQIRDLALAATDDLRHFLAAALPHPAKI